MSWYRNYAHGDLPVGTPDIQLLFHKSEPAGGTETVAMPIVGAYKLDCILCLAVEAVHGFNLGESKEFRRFLIQEVLLAAELAAILVVGEIMAAGTYRETEPLPVRHPVKSKRLCFPILFFIVWRLQVAVIAFHDPFTFYVVPVALKLYIQFPMKRFHVQPPHNLTVPQGAVTVIISCFLFLILLTIAVRHRLHSTLILPWPSL